jgi:hypothetical protein
MLETSCKVADRQMCAARERRFGDACISVRLLSNALERDVGQRQSIARDLHECS